MDREELEELYNEFVITNGFDFWKYVVMERLLMREEEINITEEQIEEIAENIMDNDTLWQEIDYTVSNAIDDEGV